MPDIGTLKEIRSCSCVKNELECILSLNVCMAFTQVLNLTVLSKIKIKLGVSSTPTLFPYHPIHTSFQHPTLPIPHILKPHIFKLISTSTAHHHIPSISHCLLPRLLQRIL